MLVVTIIGILAALVIPKIAGRGEEAREKAAYADIHGGIKTALDSFEVDNGFYPRACRISSSSRATPGTGAGRILIRRCFRWIRGAIPTSIIIPANTTPPATICFPSARTPRKAPTMTLSVG